MDEKTRKGISTGLLGLSLMLCLAGLFGPYWLTLNGYEGNSLVSWSLDEARLEVGEERSSDSLSELCELEEEVVDSTDADTCAIARAGAVATVFLWLGILFTVLTIVHSYLPVEVLDWMDERIPESVTATIVWFGGAFMLIGVLLWYILLPDIGTVDVGRSAYLTVMAGLVGLGSIVFNKYEIDVVVVRRES
ncbi:MAG: hypothetical protein VXW82_04065 [Candidatus Thermoplasmatota archaeon]|nr:hypothetical protein [Candidatus Thermoplasmatota archaeon]MEC8708584.1 hypothetical protein [Candidatus Thermoplasmatota archaeon]